MENADIVRTLAATVPIFMIFILMLGFKLASWKAGGIALIASGLLAAFVWKLDAAHIFEAAGEGVLAAILPVVWVIFTAMLLYNLCVKCGAMDTIRTMLARYAPDEPVQVLLIVFAFGGFLESVSGFGTAVAVPAAILMLFGFKPMRAAVICLVSNTLAVAFGVVGIPVITLASVTSLPVGPLSLMAALQLLPFCIFMPFLLVRMTVKTWREMNKYIWLCLLSGIAFAAGQTLSAWLLGPELPAVVGSILSMAVIVFWQKVKHKEDPAQPRLSASLQFKAWSAYLIILVLVVCTRLIPALGFLDQAPFKIAIPIYEGGKPFTASLLTNPGTLILLASIAFCFIYRISPKGFFRSAWDTIKQVKFAALTVIFIVALAKILGYSGMTNDLALGLAAATGSFFPLISPIIGAMGTFITGSDTSSNILFGLLQKQTALYIGANETWITAANAAGATIGKMLSPLSIALAATSTGLKGNEAGILKKTLPYAAVFAAVMAVLVYAVEIIL